MTKKIQQTSIFNYKSKEFLLNLKASDIPNKNSLEYNDFIINEEEKCIGGVNINGINIPGSLYFELNHWFMGVDTLDEYGNVIPIVKHPELRDNSWLIHNAYEEAYKEKKILVIGGSRQIGKELADYEIVMTSKGEIPICNLKIGDIAYGKDGKETTITGVFPQGVKAIYRMTLLDGRTIDCGLDHQWEIESSNKFYVKTTKELLKLTLKHKHKKAGYTYRYKIPSIQPVEFEKKELPINPYLLGLLLGDGTTCHSTPSISTIDQQIVDNIKGILGDDYEITHDIHEFKIVGYYCKRYLKYIGKDKYTVDIHGHNPLYKKLKELNLHDKISYTKFIPEIYKYSSVQDRIDLLSGIIDSDGWVGTAGTIEVKLVNQKLAEEVLYVARSLGIRGEINTKMTKWSSGGKSGESLVSRVHLRTDLSISRLDRKLDRITKNRTRTNSVSIEKIEYIGEHSATCISVDNESHLFLTKDFIPTHNTVTITSLLGRQMTLFQNSKSLALYSNSEDEEINAGYLETGLENLEYLKIPRLDKNWKGGLIRLGYKQQDNIDNIWSTLYMRNTNKGVNTEVGAGTTLNFFVYEEIAKSNMAKAFAAVKPALVSRFGYRCSPVMVFCVCAGTKVWNNNGELLNIEDLKVDKGIIGWDFDKKEISKEIISYWQPPTKKQCLRISTISGKFLECSLDHPIYSRERYLNNNSFKRETKWIKACRLKIGDMIAVVDEINIWKDEKFQFDPRIIGLLVGDGTYTIAKNTNSCSVKLHNCDIEVWDYVEKITTTRDSVKPQITKDGIRILRKATIHKCIPELRRLGIAGQSKDNKRLPINIENYCKKDVCEFLAGYFDSDGCVYFNPKTKYNLIKLSSANIEILKEVQMLLLKLGVQSKIYYCKPNFNNPKTTRGHYDLNINDQDSFVNFYNNIKFLIKRKQEKLKLIYDYVTINNKQKSYKLNNLFYERIKKIEIIGSQDVYNLTTSNTHTYIANGFITHNTGGNVDKSKDAKNFFMNPEANDVLPFENEGKKTGLFIGGWYRQDFKIETTLSKYLKINTSSELDSIKMYSTDFDLANKVLDKENLLLLTDPDKSKYLKHKMYYPRSIQDMFLSENENPFPREALLQQKQFLESNPVGQNIELFRNITGKVELKFSNKFPIDKYPVTKGDNLDAPIVMYDSPAKFNGQKGIHLIGVDGYADDESSISDSLGSIYVFRRFHSDLSDPFNGCMVASYTARPKTMKEFNETCLKLAEFYDATIMYEHVNAGFKDFFESKNKYHLLIPTPSLTKEISPNSKAGNTTGLRATPGIQKHALNLSLDYDNEELPNGQLGTTRILDTVLIDEKLAYDGVKNTDRYIAFSMAIEALYMYKKYTVIIEEPTKVMEVFQNKTAFNLQFNKQNSNFDLHKKGAFNFNK